MELRDPGETYPEVLEDMLKPSHPDSASSNESPFDHRSPKLRYLHHMDKDLAWQKCYNIAEKYDNDICQTYREQLDTLLVFAGLFSAVVTAFTVESYKWLQSDPNEAAVQLLQQAVSLLAQAQNTSLPIHVPSQGPQLSSPAMIRINTYWFLSLTLSLSAALLGILCKQWVREYERNAGHSHHIALAVRHIKHEGLEAWGVGGIVAAVPLILQLGLALFLIGILELLWRLHASVAAWVTAVCWLTGMIYVATTFLPLLQCVYLSAWFHRHVRNHGLWPPDLLRGSFLTAPQCPYKSPQAWLVMRLFLSFVETFLSTISSDVLRVKEAIDPPLTSWTRFDLRWRSAADQGEETVYQSFRALEWLARTIGDTQLLTLIWSCAWGKLFDTARGDGNVGSKTRSSIEFLQRALGGRTNADSGDLLAADDPIRSQELLFLFATQKMSINLAMEMFLRLAPVAGLRSEFVSKGIRAIDHISRTQAGAELDEGLAIGLIRLFQLNGWDTSGPGYTSAEHPLALFNVAIRILSASETSERFIPALCGVATVFLGQLESRVPQMGFFESERTFRLLSEHKSKNDGRKADGETLDLVGRFIGYVEEHRDPFGDLVDPFRIAHRYLQPPDVVTSAEAENSSPQDGQADADAGVNVPHTTIPSIPSVQE